MLLLRPAFNGVVFCLIIKAVADIAEAQVYTNFRAWGNIQSLVLRQYLKVPLAEVNRVVAGCLCQIAEKSRTSLLSMQ